MQRGSKFRTRQLKSIIRVPCLQMQTPHRLRTAVSFIAARSDVRLSTAQALLFNLSSISKQPFTLPGNHLYSAWLAFNLQLDMACVYSEPCARFLSLRLYLRNALSLQLKPPLFTNSVILPNILQIVF